MSKKGYDMYKWVLHIYGDRTDVDMYGSGKRIVWKR